jgi:hypothetical protein
MTDSSLIYIMVVKVIAILFVTLPPAVIKQIRRVALMAISTGTQSAQRGKV